jgi:hypothetical protein
MKAQHFIPLALLVVGCSTTAPRTAALTADQARTLARQFANEEARALYGFQPFWNGAPASFVQGRWVWRDRRGCAFGDMEATVSLAPDGSARSVDVILLDSRTQRF